MNKAARTAMMLNIQEAHQQAQIKKGVDPQETTFINFTYMGKRIPNSQLRFMAREFGVSRNRGKDMPLVKSKGCSCGRGWPHKPHVE